MAPTSTAQQVRAGRWAGPCFAAVALFSVYALFWPRPAGPQGLDGSDKLVHLLLFALLAGTTRWRFGPGTALLAAVVGYAALSELVQALLLPDRSGDLLDLLADVVGVGLGAVIAARLVRAR